MKCIHGNDMGQSCEHCVGATPGYRAIEPSALDSMTNTTYVEVPSHRDQINERLCNELVNLSRNVAGLTGVAKALIDVGERMGHGAPKPCPEKHLKDYDSSELRAELWRRNGEVVPQHREVKHGPVTESEVMAFAVSHWGKYALSEGANKHLRACLTEFASSRGLCD